MRSRLTQCVLWAQLAKRSPHKIQSLIRGDGGVTNVLLIVGRQITLSYFF